MEKLYGIFLFSSISFQQKVKEQRITQWYGELFCFANSRRNWFLITSPEISFASTSSDTDISVDEIEAFGQNVCTLDIY